MTETDHSMAKKLEEIKDEIVGLEALLTSPIFDKEDKEKIQERLKMLYKKAEDLESSH